MVDRVEIRGISINPKAAVHDISFIRLLKKYLKEVDNDQHMADKAINEFLVGKKELYEVMLAVEKADISFRLFMKIRDKLIEAYQEIMRMQV